MAAMQISSCGSPFAKLVYEQCGEDLGDILTLVRVEVDEAQKRFITHFLSCRVLDQKEYQRLIRAVQNAAAGLDVSVCLHFESDRIEDIRDGALLSLQNEHPVLAKLMARAQWDMDENRIVITLPGSVRLEALAVMNPEQTVKALVRSMFNKNCSVVIRSGELQKTQDYEARRRETAARFAVDAVQVQKQETPQRQESEARPKSRAAQDPNWIYGMSVQGDPIAINELSEISGRVVIEGDILSVEEKLLKSGEKLLVVISVTDYTSSVSVKLFLKIAQAEDFHAAMKGVKRVIVQGDCTYDTYAREQVIMCRGMFKQPVSVKTDDAPIKRVELHLHTRMSEMDSVVNPSELVKLAVQYGHDTLAVTDHGVVQAYPDLEAAIAKQKANIKLIFGLEGYLYDDKVPMLDLPAEASLRDLTYVVFDVETTGLDCQSDRLIEIAAVKLQEGKYVDRFSLFVDPERNIPDKIVRLTNINNSMVAGAPKEEEAVRRFLEFAEGAVLVAHNAAFDVSFIRFVSNKYGLNYHNVSLDTLALSRLLLPELKSYKLNKLCDHLGVLLDGHHRAINDTEATANMTLKLMNMLYERNITTAGALNELAGDSATGNTYHICIYARNKQGLFNLYKLVTESHLHHFYKRPRIPRSLLIKLREGLLIGSACEAGELFRAVVNRESDQEIERIANFYDFLEVQPIGNNEFMLRQGKVQSRQELIDMNKKIIELGERMNKPVVATGDVHFLKERDEYFRRIILSGMGFEDADQQAPLYYRTTQEMLDEFSYLPPERAKEIVITNTRMIADMCEPMESFPRDKLYTPKMEGAEEEVRQMAMDKAHRIYGNPLPELVEKRLERELTAIIEHGYAVLYLIAHKVVGKSLSDGYLVGSRGSVGSSFAATMCDITEVNPLPPHYVCPKCCYSDFNIDIEKYGCGYDLPKMNCPKCGAEMDRQGFDIPFEVFMGFKGDKAPDIDLNFSGVYQPVIHKYIEDLFGHDYVFRAGTIGGVAEKTAMGYVLKYCEEHGLRISNAEKQRLAAGCIDVKRTTGQHPAGVVVLPKEYEIYHFTPLQYPANDASKGIITTHFDFNSLHDTLLKLDILGHDDPTTIKMLENLTGLNALELPLNDEKVMSLFLSTEAIGVNPEELGSTVGTFGIPEMGTKFVRKMLVETKPQTFADLVRISGLSHGTDVWSNNAQLLVNEGIAQLPELICTREDIMNRLIQKGVSATLAFKTMESVRKGKGMTEEMEQAMHDVAMPQWFIDSCNKIKYMFPKAHAAAYVTMALRIAYFKVYYPVAFYIAFFTVRADDFDITLMQGGVESIRSRIEEYNDKPELNAREKGIVTMLELGLEMKLRKIEFADVSIYESDATDFLPIGENLIRPPLTALAGLGENAAKAIVEARKDGEFTSQENLMMRAKVSKGVMEVLLNNGCLKGMTQNEQIQFFELD